MTDLPQTDPLLDVALKDWDNNYDEYQPPVYQSANIGVQFPYDVDYPPTFNDYVLINESNIHQYITDDVTVGEYLSACYDGPEYIWNDIGWLANMKKNKDNPYYNSSTKLDATKVLASQMNISFA